MFKKMILMVLSVIMLLPAGISYAASSGDKSLTVSGNGFKPNSQVTVKSHDGSSFTTNANSGGAINFNLNISDSGAGSYPVRAEGQSASSDKDSLILSGNFSVNGTKVSNNAEIGSGTQQVQEPYARIYEGPLNASMVSVLGEKIVPKTASVKTVAKAKKTVEGELPYTGGSPLWIVLAAGMILTTAGFGAKVRARD